MSLRISSLFVLFLQLPLVFGGSQFADAHPTHLPVILPPYHFYGLQAGVTGTLTFDLTLEDNVVTSIVEVSSNLTSKRPDEWALGRLRARTRTMLNKLATVLNEKIQARVEVEFRIDSDLGSQQRNYLIEYDEEHWVITRIIITGPEID